VSVAALAIDRGATKKKKALILAQRTHQHYTLQLHSACIYMCMCLKVLRLYSSLDICGRHHKLQLQVFFGGCADYEVEPTAFQRQQTAFNAHTTTYTHTPLNHTLQLRSAASRSELLHSAATAATAATLTAAANITPCSVLLLQAVGSYYIRSGRWLVCWRMLAYADVC
jgi:hypothetical protein